MHDIEIRMCNHDNQTDTNILT